MIIVDSVDIRGAIKAVVRALNVETTSAEHNHFAWFFFTCFENLAQCRQVSTW